MNNTKRSVLVVVSTLASALGLAATASATDRFDCRGGTYDARDVIVCQSSTNPRSFAIQTARRNRDLQVSRGGSAVIHAFGLNSSGAPLEDGRCQFLMSTGGSKTVRDCDGMVKHQLITNL